MGSHYNLNLPKDALDSFSKVVSQIPQDQQPTLQVLVKKICASVCIPGYSHDFLGTMNVIKEIFNKEAGTLNSADQNSLRKSLVAQLALNLPSIVGPMKLPEIVLEQYPGTFNRLAAFLLEETEDEYGFSEDLFTKDICFTLGRSIPCGAQIVELAGYVRIRSAIRHMLVYKDFGVVWDYFKAKGGGEWFRIHTDVRNLADFNEPGWDACYHRVAALLAQRSTVRGMVGTSWFYDPQLVEISPRLAYLQLRLLERGAFPIGHRGSPLDVERATLTSKTRRQLHESGKYNPSCYSLVWPRKQMLEWSDLKQEGSS